MNEVLNQIKEELNKLVQIIENYTPLVDDVVIIQKDDLKDIKWIKKLNSYIHLFEYKNSIRFTLRESSSYSNDFETYNKLMDGSIERIVLNKIPNNLNTIEIEKQQDSDNINYKLEEWQKTKLRDNYNNDNIN